MVPMSMEVGLVIAILVVVIALFVTELLSVDVTAILVLVALGLISSLPGMEGFISNKALFAGFSSNAVMSMIAVMIVGAGLDRSGLMKKIAVLLIRIVNSKPKRVLPLLSGAVGIISSFMQNIGAAALFIPVTKRLASRMNLSARRLLMPMGFSAILGGTLTLVGSGPLILLNDLLPEGVERFGLFEVTPMGLSLMLAGIAYFMLFGGRLLSDDDAGVCEHDKTAASSNLYGIESGIELLRISSLYHGRQQTIGEIESEFDLNIVAISGDDVTLSPHRQMVLAPAMNLAVVASAASLSSLLATQGIERLEQRDSKLEDMLSSDSSGTAEIVIRPKSQFVGKSIRDIQIRKNYGLTPLAICRSEGVVSQQLRDQVFRVGDHMLCHCDWESLARLETNPGIAVITEDYPKGGAVAGKLGVSVAILLVTLGLIVLSDLALSLVLMSGAMAMVLARVISMEEAYKAVSWKSVFLLAGLIPLGTVVESSGAAAWITQSVLAILGHDVAPLLLYFAVACLATLFSLVMSNIGATVILVPLAIQIAQSVGADPRICALIIAVSVSNSFLIPTHQVNALIMTPGGYSVADYLRVGSGMTVLFIAVAVGSVFLWY